MPALRSLATAAALAVAVAGCGVGAGAEQRGSAELVVTRDHGAERLLTASADDPREGETVVRLLDREAEIETSYGGNFVDSIEGIAGSLDAGRTRDWFFYVNGYWSPIGAGEATLHPGDRIWWDYRDWTEAYRVSAVVGSFPEPFRSGYEGERFATEVVCLAARAACEQARDRLDAVGAEAEVVGPRAATGPGPDTLRVLVGPWSRLRGDRIAAVLERGPAESGVYAVPRRCGEGWALDALDDGAEVRATLDRAAWIAALRPDDRQPTWVVSASDRAGVEVAVEMLNADALAGHYAIAAAGGDRLRLPVTDELEAASESGCPR